jgi:hypothetical protein
MKTEAGLEAGRLPPAASPDQISSMKTEAGHEAGRLVPAASPSAESILQVCVEFLVHFRIIKCQYIVGRANLIHEKHDCN